MQLYGRATRDYVARNDKELTVMSGERVEVSLQTVSKPCNYINMYVASCNKKNKPPSPLVLYLRTQHKLCEIDFILYSTL